MLIMKTMITKKTAFYKKFFVGLGVIVLFVVPLFALGQVHGQGKNEVCQGITGGACPSAAQADSSIQNVIKTGLNLFSIVIGVAGVIMVMLAGFRYITAGGDASKTATAQNTILWAAVGLIVASLAQVIVRFILGNV